MTTLPGKITKGIVGLFSEIILEKIDNRSHNDLFKFPFVSPLKGVSCKKRQQPILWSVRGVYVTPHPLTVESLIMSLPQTLSFQQTQLGWNKEQHSHKEDRGWFDDRNIELMGLPCQVLLLENLGLSQQGLFTHVIMDPTYLLFLH